MKISRRDTLRTLVGSAALSTLSLPVHLSAAPKGAGLKGRVNHSVCRWCYNDIPMETFCKRVYQMGLRGMDLLGPDQWEVAGQYGLKCAMAEGAGLGITRGFNDPDLHTELIESYQRIFPQLKAAGINQVICFSGNRNGRSDEEGLDHCTRGLKMLIPMAEKYGVTLVMELLNSKVDHKDYQCDHTAWGVELCRRIDSDHFKLLYDIYHMQIMEGDVIATIQKYHPYIAHYHTGGVPGRNEINTQQELYYPAIVRAILETGFKGYIAQEFIPTATDKLASLKTCVEICDV